MPPAANIHDSVLSELTELRERNLLRTPRVLSGPGPVAKVDGRECIVLCSNDYLGQCVGLPENLGLDRGAAASRLVAGSHLAHAECESRLATLAQSEGALLFTSGYAANVGALAALTNTADLIVSDSLNHASIIDGARLSRARVAVFNHLDVGHLERILEHENGRRVFVVTETVFSMDGDSPDLAAYRKLCDKHRAVLYLDDSHGLGCHPTGVGTQGVRAEIYMAGLGKAAGLQGGFIGSSRNILQLLVNRARSYVFSTGLSPIITACVSQALPRLTDVQLQGRLSVNTNRLADGLRSCGYEVPKKPERHSAPISPIIPIVIGDERRALDLSTALFEEGVFVQAIRPPTVPQGTSRLRVTATAAHTPEHIEAALTAFAKVRKAMA